MAEEFIIKSQQIEDKINQLLPSQGGFQAGVDFSASTMVIPIVDLTETAEGSNLRQDLQSSLSLTSVTSHAVGGATSTIINTTGYFRIFGTVSMSSVSGGARSGNISITDGTTTKVLFAVDNNTATSTTTFTSTPYDFIVFLQAGDSVTITSSNAVVEFIGVSRQIADINGNLVNP